MLIIKTLLKALFALAVVLSLYAAPICFIVFRTKHTWKYPGWGFAAWFLIAALITNYINKNSDKFFKI